MSTTEEKIWFVKKPCAHCPYRRDVAPFLTRERAEELATLTQNPYTNFDCHKTLGWTDDGETVAVGGTLTCAGFLTMQTSETDGVPPDGFTPSYDVVYATAGEMVYAHES